jgi:hypothetical protein
MTAGLFVSCLSVNWRYYTHAAITMYNAQCIVYTTMTLVPLTRFYSTEISIVTNIDYVHIYNLCETGYRNIHRRQLRVHSHTLLSYLV